MRPFVSFPMRRGFLKHCYVSSRGKSVSNSGNHESRTVSGCTMEARFLAGWPDPSRNVHEGSMIVTIDKVRVIKSLIEPHCPNPNFEMNMLSQTKTPAEALLVNLRRKRSRTASLALMAVHRDMEPTGDSQNCVSNIPLTQDGHATP
jgi:hypothetical protein